MCLYRNPEIKEAQFTVGRLRKGVLVMRADKAAGSVFAFYIVSNILPGFSSVAYAQVVIPDEVETVMDRSRPEWDSVPIRFGSFKLDAEGRVRLNYDNNVFATNVDQIGDVLATAGLRATVASDWSRHSLSLNGSIDAIRGFNRDENDITPYSVTTKAQLDISPATTLRGSMGYERAFEGRGSFTDVALLGPLLVYNRLQGDVAVTHSMSHLKFEVQGSVDQYLYASTQADDESISRKSRDFRTVRGVGRVNYAFSPGISAFGQVTVNEATYPNQQAGRNRGSKGYEVMGGVELGVTHLLRGRLGVGQFRQRYRSADFPDIKGLTFAAQLEWSPTRLATFAVMANRSIQRSPIVGVAGIKQTSYFINVDYEYRRNIILTGSGRYTVNDFVSGDRTQNDARAGVDVKWLLNRHLRLAFELDIQRTNSNGVFERDFTRKQAAITLRYAL